MRHMLKSKWIPYIAIILSVFVGVVTTVAKAEAAFVGSEESLSQLMRSQDAATVQRVLENKMVQQRLQALGYSPEEIQSRLDQLNDSERHALATQIDELVPAGDGVGLIIGVLLIILLIVVILAVVDKKIVVTD